MLNNHNELALGLADLIPFFFLGLLAYGIAEFFFIRKEIHNLLPG